MRTILVRARDRARAAALDLPFGVRFEALAYVALGLLVVLATFLNRWGSFTPDTEPQLYLAPGRVFIQSLFAWQASPALGQANFQAGEAPVAAMLFMIRALGASPWVAVRVWRGLLLIVAGWGAARFFDQLAGERSGPVGRAVAAILYVANPYVVVSGASTPVLLPYALFPWMMLFFSRSVNEPRRWRWPAAFALSFFLMGGLNAGIVPLFLLLGIPAYILYAKVAERRPFRRTLRPLAKCAGLLVLLSAYWIVPAIAARGTASTIAYTTERPADVASTSSYAETLRLLGLWPLYGRQGAQPFLPNAVGYITNPLVVLATFAIPVLAAVGALVSRSRLRVLAATLLAVGAPVMVGLFPPQHPTPFARALSAFFNHFPGGIGFRTTNKVGALVVLGLVLLLALGAVEAAAWIRRRKDAPVLGLLAGVPVIVLLASVFPAWNGNLYGSESTDIPAYWQQAAHALDNGSANTRVLFLPGEEFADYRWGKRGPTDLTDSLLSRPSALRDTIPNGSAYAADFLAALDVPINNGTYMKGTVPSLARYLGVHDILVRNDMTWEEWGGARPSTIAAMLGNEPGLRLAASYGSPGQFTIAPGPVPASGPRSDDSKLPPLLRYVVSGSRPIVRAEPVTRTVLIDGDNFGLAHLPPLGLLPGDPAFRFLGAMSSSDLQHALQVPGVRIVLTDSNRRRGWDFRRTGTDYSATLGPNDTFRPGGDLSFKLFANDPATQTVALLSGARSINATSYGSVFGPAPQDQPAFAFDGNRRTPWLAGGFSGAIGQAVTITFDHPIAISTLSLRPVLRGERQISSVQIRAGSSVTPVDIPAGTARVQVSLPTPVTAPSLTVTITGVRGTGINPVGFWDIAIPGVRVTTFARLPLSFERAAAGLDAAGKAALARTPLDIVMTREAGYPANGLNDEEPNLFRQFTLPDGRTFGFTGVGRFTAALSDATVNRLVGLPTRIVATASSRFGSGIGNRASNALDRNPATAWVPAGNPIGQFIDVRFPAQRLNRIVVMQGLPGAPGTQRFISTADLSVNGGPPIAESLTTGTTIVPIPTASVHEVRLTITGLGGLGGFVRVAELGIGSVRLPIVSNQTRLRGCVPAFDVDSHTVSVQPAATLGRLVTGLPFSFRPCAGARLALGAGSHRVATLSSWQIDELHVFSGARPKRSPQPPKPPTLTVTSSTPTRMTITTDGSSSPYYLVIGQGFDPRWTATMDGASLGPPILLDGYSTAWEVRSPGSHSIVVSFGPQHPMNFSIALSLIGLVVVAGVLVRRKGAS